MANEYTWDIGYNWQSREILNSTGYPLQHGLVSSSGAPAWVTQFSQGDSFEFRLFDITPLMGGTGPVVVNFKQFQLEVTASNNKSATNVFGLSPTNLPPPAGSSSYDAQTGVLTCEQDVWTGGSEHLSPVFSANNGMPLRRWSMNYAFKFDVGTFGDTIDISVRLEVEDVNGTVSKTFVFDPQLKVGPG